ncbi:unnamed protein product [Prunus armeniaca]
MGKVGKQYASYTGVMARTIIPIYLSNSAAVDDHLKEKIWTEITFGIQILMASRQQAHIDKKIVAKDEEVDRSLLWKVAREDKNGKIVDEEVAELAGTIEKLLKEKEEVLITVSGYNDVLAMALGTLEHAGRVRGVGGFVKPSSFFNVPRKKRECVKGNVERTRCFAARDKKDYGRTTEKARSCARTSSKANGDAKAGDFRSTL